MQKESLVLLDSQALQEEMVCLAGQVFKDHLDLSVSQEKMATRVTLAFLERKVSRVVKAQWDPPVLLAQEGLLETKVEWVPLETRASEVKWAAKAPKERMDLLASLGLMDHLAHRAFLVLLASRENKVIMEWSEPLVLLVNQASLGLWGQKVEMAFLVLQDLKVYRARKVSQVHLVSLVHLARMEFMASLVHPGQKARKEKLACKVHQEQEVYLVLRVQRAIQVPLDSLETLENKAQVAPKESQVSQATMANREILVPQGILVQEVNLEFKDRLARRGNLVHQADKATLACLETRVTSDPKGLQVHLDLLASKVLLEWKAPLVPEATLAQLVK